MSSSTLTRTAGGRLPRTSAASSPLATKPLNFLFGSVRGADARRERMRTIKRYLRRAFADPGSAVSVIGGGCVGAVRGGAYEEFRAPTHTAPACQDGVYKGAQDD